MSGFTQALPIILRSEGGYVDDPVDRGGATNFGITQKTYDAWRVKHGHGKVAVREITTDEVEAIYHSRYWNAAKCDALPWPASLCHFDASVNHGPRRAAKLLQRVLGVTPDGKIGPQTLGAVSRIPGYKLTTGLLFGRIAFYVKIVGSRPSQIKFLRGWIRRVLHLWEETETA